MFSLSFSVGLDSSHFDEEILIVDDFPASVEMLNESAVRLYPISTVEVVDTADSFVVWGMDMPTDKTGAPRF